MNSVRPFLLAAVIFAISSSKSIPPGKDAPDDESIYTVHYKPKPLFMMLPSFNNSIPLEAQQACAKKRAIACPSPSQDGSYSCIRELQICDHELDCPGGEDEIPLICFFNKFHEMMLRMPIEHAKRLYREVATHHSHRPHHRQ